MDREDYCGIKSLVDSIDGLSDSADKSMQMIEDFMKGTDDAFLFIHANGEQYKIGLRGDLANRVFLAVLEYHSNIIYKKQTELKQIIDCSIEDTMARLNDMQTDVMKKLS